MEKYNLSSEWNIWYHSINDTSWDKNSYQKLITIRNLFDCNLLRDTFQQNHYQNGMYFCMKGDIAPLWEDPNNRDGGCLSFKIHADNVINDWNTILFHCITEGTLKDKNEAINGVSISPKKEFNIIKLWFKDDHYEETYKSLFNKLGKSFEESNSMYKKNVF